MAHLARIQLLDAQHPPCRYLEVCARRYDDWTLAAELQSDRDRTIWEHAELTSKVDGERVLAAAPAIILPTFPEPVYKTAHQDWWNVSRRTYHDPTEAPSIS